MGNPAVDKVCASESKWRILGCSANEVHNDVFNCYKPQKSRNEIPQRPEKITYCWKDLEKEFVTHLCNIINGNGIDPTQTQCVNVCHGGDHGKGKFRMTTKIIVMTNCGEYFEIIYPLADVKRKKIMVLGSEVLFYLNQFGCQPTG